MPFKDPEAQRKWVADRRAEIRERGDKKLNLGSATALVKSIAALREEIAKCEIVCANCHSIRTYERKVARNGA